MSSFLPGQSPLAYNGIKEPNPPNVVVKSTDPTISDYNGFDIGDIWINKLTRDIWMLSNKISRPNRLGTAYWALINTSQGGGIYEYTSTAADYVVADSDTYVSVTNTSSARTITLPASADVGKYYIIKDSSGAANVNNITVTAGGVVLIDGNATYTIATSYGSYMFLFNGTSYEVN